MQRNQNRGALLIGLTASLVLKLPKARIGLPACLYVLCASSLTFFVHFRDDDLVSQGAKRKRRGFSCPDWAKTCSHIIHSDMIFNLLI